MVFPTWIEVGKARSCTLLMLMAFPREHGGAPQVVGLLEQVDSQLFTVYRLEIAVVHRVAPVCFCPTTGLDRDHFDLVGQLEEVAEAVTQSMTGQRLDRMRGFLCALITQPVIGERRFQAELPQGSAQQDRETWRVCTLWDEVLTIDARQELSAAAYGRGHLPCPLHDLPGDGVLEDGSIGHHRHDGLH